MKDKTNKQAKTLLLHDCFDAKKKKNNKNIEQKLLRNLRLLRLTDEYFKSILNKFIKRS